jgi:hypothetical protein
MESCTLAGAALVSTRARGNCGTLRLGGRQIGRDAVAHEQLSSRIFKLPHCGSISSHTNLEPFFRLLRDPNRLRPGLSLRAFLQLSLDCCQLRIGLGCS